MPRLDERLLKTVVYLYDSETAANEGTRLGGSGFLVGMPSSLPGAVFTWVVTNRHVVYGGFPVIRTGKAPDVRPLVRREDEWIANDDDDLAITPYGFMHQDGSQLNGNVGYIPRDWFLTEDFAYPNPYGETYEALPFGPGDETVVVGRFVGYDGRQRNEPVARFGNLVSARAVPIYHRHLKKEQTSLLVESRSLPGYSGSPIFGYRIYGPYGGTPFTVKRPTFLGVDWGHLAADPENRSEFTVIWGDADHPDPARYNSGIMVGVPAWRLSSLLESTEAGEVEEEETEKRKAQASSGAELDVASDERQFERFEHLTRHVLSVRKDELDELRRRDQT